MANTRDYIGSGNDLAAGRDTAIDTVIRRAGGENVPHAVVSGYQPLSAEAALAAAPDVILLTERNLEGIGGIDAVLGRAALAATPAGRAGRVIAIQAGPAGSLLRRLQLQRLSLLGLGLLTPVVAVLSVAVGPVTIPPGDPSAPIIACIAASTRMLGGRRMVRPMSTR